MKGEKKLGTLGPRAKNENKVNMKDATAGGGRAEFRSRGNSVEGRSQTNGVNGRIKKKEKQ